MIYSRDGKKSIWRLDTIYERTKDEKWSSTQISNRQVSIERGLDKHENFNNDKTDKMLFPDIICFDIHFSFCLSYQSSILDAINVCDTANNVLSLCDETDCW